MSFEPGGAFVKTRFCDFDPMYRAALVAVGLLASEGCGGEHPPGASAGEDHIGHVIPAHKPAAFPDAVRRLRELNDQFVRDGIASPAGASPDREAPADRAGHRQLAPRDRRRQRPARGAVERRERPVRDDRRRLSGDRFGRRRQRPGRSRERGCGDRKTRDDSSSRPIRAGSPDRSELERHLHRTRTP